MLARLVAPRWDRDIIFRADDGFFLKFSPDTKLGRGVFWRGTDELETTVFFRRWLNAEDTFYDIGANFGVYSLQAATMLKERGQVVSVEPHPVAYQALIENISINAFDHIATFPIALGANSGVSTLNEPLQGIGASTLGDMEPQAVRHSYTVEVRTLDDLVDELPFPPTLIKLDVEGFEEAVMIGASKVLTSSAPSLIVLEVNQEASNRAGNEASGALDVLTDYGYQFFKLSHAIVRRNWVPVRWEPRLDKGIQRRWFNAVAYRPEFHQDRISEIWKMIR